MNILEKIKQPEGRKLEFKEKFPEKSDLLKSLVAFANGSGGNLIIGITDKTKEIAGVTDPISLEEKITNLVYDSIVPIISPYITIHNLHGNFILNIQILPGNNPPYFLKSKGVEKGTYIRIGSSNRLASTEIIGELRRQARGISFEGEPDIHKAISDLDRKALAELIPVDSLENPKKELLYWRIANKNNGDYYPTIGGIVLFGKEELVDYNFAAVRITRFNGHTLSDIAESVEFTIPLINKINDMYQWIHDRLLKDSILSGVKRISKNRIPDFAIREALINAIVHRDYNNKHSTIKVNIFNDRIEFLNPGILYGNIDIEDLGTGVSECRNRNIVRIFRKLNLMEELGTGIARIRQLFIDSNLKAPVFFEQGNYFKVILPQITKENDLQEEIYQLIREYDTLSTSEIADKLGFHSNTILKYINKLVSQQKIFSTGLGRSRKYMVSQK
jgi:ATP-dependent DNA helicase RecG